MCPIHCLTVKGDGQFLGAEEVESAAVVGRDAMLADGLAVLSRGVAHVVLPVVVGILLRQADHLVVAVGLGQDGGGSDGEVLAVALDDGGMGQVAVGLEAVAIDDDGLGPHLELVEGTVHGQDGGVEDIDLVDLLRRDDAHGPCHRVALDILAQGIALAGGELLGVVEPFVVIVGMLFGTNSFCCSIKTRRRNSIRTPT